MSKNIDLSIIIVSYNTIKYLKEVLDSLYKKVRSVNYEVIIVDNASTDGSREYLSNLCTRRKNFVLVKSSENVGFAAGNNLGVKKAKGNFVLFLNSDTEILNDFFSEIIEWMKDRSEVGIVSCALLNTDRTLQGTGGYFPNLLNVFSWMTIQDFPLVDKLIKPFHPMKEKSFLKDESIYKKESKLDWVTGAFFLVKRKLLDEIGVFDTDYFMYTEEVDFCYRAAKKGWEVWYLPQWQIVHHGGASGTKESAVLSEFMGVKTFFKKHYPKWQFPILRLILKIGSLGRVVVMGLREGPNSAKIYAKAFIGA